MSNQDVSPNVQKAIAFFARAGLSRLLSKLREKYIELGHVGGQIVMEDSTSAERRDIASFLGKPPYSDSSFRVRLADVEKALKHSFGCSLPDLLSAFFPNQPLVTRVERREAHAKHQEDFRTALLGIGTPEESHGRFWLLHGVHGQEWLFSRYKNASKGEQEQQLQLVRYIVSVLDQLPRPGKPERLALFAQRTSGDPHALDPDKPAGRLFLLALHDLKRGAEGDIDWVGDHERAGAPEGPHQDRPYGREGVAASQLDRGQALRLYAEAGLLVDTISSYVAVFNLAGAVDANGVRDSLPISAGPRVLLLPLRQLLEWKSVLAAGNDIYVFENPQVFEEIISTAEFEKTLPTVICTSGWPSVAAMILLEWKRVLAAGNDIYVLENPQVFEEIISTADFEKTLPTVICTSGWPSVAAMMLLDLLLAHSPENVLHYSGDFDLKGLQIAAYLLERYPGRCHLWHFDPDAYSVALQSGGVSARANELDMLSSHPDIFAPLVAVIQKKKVWAYQEGVVDLLIADMRENAASVSFSS